MAFCIMRIEKRRRSSLYGLQIENNRTQADHIERGRDFARSDINWDLTPFNIHFVKAENWGKAVTAALQDAGVKERKNSVVVLDGLYTASAEWFKDKTLDEIIDYFEACLAFHEKTYGPILSAVLHVDEGNYHLHAQSIPLTRTGDTVRLSADRIMGGRNDYRKRQDQFFEEVGKPRGMERGESHDPEHIRKHLSVQEYKRQQLEIQVDELQQQNKKLQAECKKLEWKNTKLQELNAALAEQIEQPFLQYSMIQFIRNAKVRGENGEIKNVYDGFNAYMERHFERLQAEWQQQCPPERDAPEQEAIIEHERELEFEYDDREIG